MSEELLRENERLKASNHRLEVEAIQRQGEFDRVRLAANKCDLENQEIRAKAASANKTADALRNRVHQLYAGYREAIDDLECIGPSNEIERHFAVLNGAP